MTTHLFVMIGLGIFMTAGSAAFQHPVAPRSGAGNGDQVTIYVGPQIRDGLVDVDRGVLDSVKHIQNELKRSKQFAVVDRAEAATIVLLVVARRITVSGGAVGSIVPDSTYGSGTITGVPQPTTSSMPGVTALAPVGRHAIDSLLRVGTYEKAITSEEPNGAGWTTVARVVVTDVTAWVDANRASLARRGSQR